MSQIENLPEDWTIIRLSETGNVSRGKFTHRPRGDPDLYDGKYPFIQTGDIVGSNHYLKSYTQTLNDKGKKVSKKFNKNTVIVTIAGNIGYSSVTLFPVYFPDSLVGIETNSSVNPHYLNYCITNRRDYLNRISTQTTQKNLNLSLLRPVKIPKPCIEEQERIASVLYSVDRNVEHLHARKTRLETLKQGLMQDLLEPEGSWKSLKPSDFAEINPDSFKPDSYEEETLPYLSLSSVSEGQLVDVESTSVSNPISSATRVVHKGDILIGTVRPKQKSHYRVTKSEDGFIASSGFVVLRPDEIDPKYLEQVVLSRDFFKQMDAYGTGSTYPSVNLGDIKNMSVPVPPKEKQKELSRILSTVDEMIEKTKEIIKEYEQLKSGLMQDLLSGEVRTPEELETIETVIGE